MVALGATRMRHRESAVPSNNVHRLLVRMPRNRVGAKPFHQPVRAEQHSGAEAW